MSLSKPEFEVERIVSDKYLVGRRFFFVKWRGFDSSENTWEPEENMANCPRLVREYFGGKGLRNTKSHNISTTLMRSIKVSKSCHSRSSSVVALASPKATPRQSVDLQPEEIDIGDTSARVATAKSDPSATDDPILTNDPTAISDSKPNTDYADFESGKVNIHDASPNVAASECNTCATDDPILIQDLAAINEPVPNIGSIPASDHTTSCDPIQLLTPKSEQLNTSGRPRRSRGSLVLPVASSKPSRRHLVDFKPVNGHNTSTRLATSNKKRNTSRKRGKQSWPLGLPLVVPKIELVRIDEDAYTTVSNEFDAKKAEFLRLGLAMAESSPRTSLNVTETKVRVSPRFNKGNRFRRQTKRSLQTVSLSRVSMSSRDVKPVIRTLQADLSAISQDDSKVWSLTSTNETASPQVLSDDDPSWQHSTTVDYKPSSKFTVRMFDRTPRPEVLTAVPFLENFDSDTEPASRVTEDSDKENTLRKCARRPAKRKWNRSRRNAKILKTNDSRRKAGTSSKSDALPTAEILPTNLPKTDDAMVLLTEQSKTGGSNLVMYFPRLKLIKSIPEKMADKYYSQSVIEYYRRSMQPQVRVARRSI